MTDWYLVLWLNVFICYAILKAIIGLPYPTKLACGYKTSPASYLETIHWGFTISGDDPTSYDMTHYTFISILYFMLFDIFHVL